MNIHPLFVHFPIGILSLYTFFEVVRIRYFTKQPYYFELKVVLSIFGVAAAFVAAATGDMAEELAQAGQNTAVDASQMAQIETHALFAMSTVTVFAVLAGSYLFEFLRQKQLLMVVTRIGALQALSRLIQKLTIPLAVLGMILLTIAGGLGAALVYGPDVDPFVQIIYNLVN